MSEIKALLSDSDGTLVDTPSLIRHGQYEAAKEYLTKHGIPAEEIPDYPTYEVLLNQTVGGRTRDTIEKTVRLLYEQSPHHLEGMNFDELYALLDPIQDRLAPEYVKAFPGLAGMVTGLGRMGIRLAIFSSGDRRMIVRNIGVALPELGMSKLFEDQSLTTPEKLDTFTQTFKNEYNLPGFTVITSDETTKHKPDPEGLVMAMNRLHVTSAESAVLGDHKYDMVAAANAGIAMRIGITHGFDDRAALKEAGATHIIDSLDEVLDILTK